LQNAGQYKAISGASLAFWWRTMADSAPVRIIRHTDAHPRTSVIIPTYNRANFLVECVAAVRNQSRTPLEIIVVDDGSDDETREALNNFRGEVRILFQPNLGKAAALNHAISVATGDLIWIVDDDDVPLPRALSILEALLEDESVGFAFGKYTEFSDNDCGARIVTDTAYWIECDPRDFLAASLLDFFVHQPGMLVRKAVYEAVGPFDESLIRSQDYEMTLRIARHAKAASTKEVVFLQRQHQGLRGTADNPITTEQVYNRWIEADASIFLKVYKEWPLDCFRPGWCTETSRGMITSLLFRASVMARRKLWTFALRDWREACRLSGGSFSKSEVELMRLAFMGKYGISEIVSNPDAQQALSDLISDPALSPVRRPLARGMVWRIREALFSRDIALATRLFFAATRLAI